MNEDLLLVIGDKIKAKRTQKKITMEELARRAEVSKSLISQIENNRTIPSLPVLFNIVHALEENLKTFFEDMHDHFTNTHVVIVRNGEATKFEKETVRGFTYKRILTRSVMSQIADFALLELKKDAARKLMIQTDAFECKYILKGRIQYEVEHEKFILEEGDTLFFDGRARHRLKNIGPAEALILVVYLF